MHKTLNIRTFFLVVMFTALAGFGYNVRMDLFFGATLFIGPLFILCLKPLLGKIKTTLIIFLLMFFYLLFLDHSLNVYLYVTEILFMIWLQKDDGGIRFYLFWDILYWVIALPVCHLYLSSQGFISNQSDYPLLYSIVIANSLLNAVIADVLLGNPYFRKFVYKELFTLSVHLKDIVFHILLIGLSTTILVYVAISARSFVESVTINADQDLSAQLDNVEYTISQLHPRYVTYAELGEASGITFLKQAMDDYEFSNGRIYMVFKDGSLYPPLIKKPTSVIPLEEGFYQLRNESVSDLFNNFFKYEDAQYLKVKETPYGTLLATSPLAFYRKSAYQLYFKHLPILIFLSLLAMIAIKFTLDWAFKAYDKLIDLTVDLPYKVKTGAFINWPTYHIHEFKLLTNHFSEITSNLTELFAEAESANEELEQQAETLIESERRLRQIALTDSLTDLPNRLHFKEFLDRLIEQRDPFAIVFIDLDRFKHVNDTYGHSTGDLLLQKVAQSLMHSFGAAHTNHHMIARLGGDEFVIVTKYDDLSALTNQLKGLLSELNQPMDLGHIHLYCVASFGVTLYPDHGNSVDELLKKADATMYVSKENGGNQVTFYSEEVQVDHSEDLNLEYELHEALAKNTFTTHYQPILMLDTEEVFGLEALVRWPHPTKGLLDSSVFIPLANEIGLISDIGSHVFARVCAENAYWQSIHLGLRPIFININGKQLDQGSLCEDLTNLLSSQDLTKSCACFDISERTLYQDTTRRLRVLKGLKALGFDLCYDGFGEISTSLTYLDPSLFTYVKIDPKLYRQQEHMPDTLSHLKHLIEYCHKTNIGLIYKNISEQEDFSLLKKLGASLGQGRALCPPLDFKQVTQYLLKKEG